ncbi:MAG: F0F1 ATP synthase subunit A [Lachnospiraceae bacterium]|nr:F0F1 ATP synthase subunit A [Lachnospiraceae bacterium]
MGTLAEELQEELTVQYMTFDVGGYEIQISESVIVTWVIMLILVLISIFLTRNLKVNNISKRQAVAELLVTKCESFVTGMIGEEGKAYVPYLMTVLIYIGLSNMIGMFDMKLFGAALKPPTKDLNVTAALALMSIILIQYASIHKRGVGGWLKSFSQPVAIVTPINILELVIRPLSLCLRLFGNILGAFTIMELIKMAMPVGLPAIFSLYFDLFDGAIQAYIFVFLTSLFIKEAIETEE